MELNVLKIKAILKKKKRNQSWLANLLGVSKQVLSYWMTSRKITHADKIAKALKVKAKSLIK